MNSPLRTLLLVAFSGVLAACQSMHPAGTTMNQAEKPHPKPDCKPVIWQLDYTAAQVGSGKGHFSIAFCPKAEYKKETTWQYKRKGGRWSVAKIVPPAGSPETVVGEVGAYILRINPPNGCDTPEQEHFEIMDGWHLPIRVSDMSGGHCPDEKHARNPAKLPVRKGGDYRMMATGIIVVIPATTPQPTDPAGYGRLRVKYLAAADQTTGNGTTYQLGDGSGNWSANQPVLPYNTTSSVTKRTGTYPIKINPPYPHNPSNQPQVTILEDQLRTVNVDYQ